MQRALFLLPLALALKPHIFMMVVDDFGWANFGPHRTPADDPTGEVQTPTMSALAAAGVLLNRNYLFWYCSPSRSALQSGRNPIHVNLNNDDLFLSNPAERTTGGFSGIPRNMTCIGNKMQTAGYETSFFGKWHVVSFIANHPAHQKPTPQKNKPEPKPYHLLNPNQTGNGNKRPRAGGAGLGAPPDLLRRRKRLLDQQRGKLWEGGDDRLVAKQCTRKGLEQ
jgi:arylsulfatase A-like enzyme